jgi:hypothetical protein
MQDCVALQLIREGHGRLRKGGQCDGAMIAAGPDIERWICLQRTQSVNGKRWIQSREQLAVCGSPSAAGAVAEYNLRLRQTMIDYQPRGISPSRGKPPPER